MSDPAAEVIQEENAGARIIKEGDYVIFDENGDRKAVLIVKKNG